MGFGSRYMYTYLRVFQVDNKIVTGFLLLACCIEFDITIILVRQRSDIEIDRIAFL